MAHDPYEDTIKDQGNLKMRAASGRVNDTRPLVAFLYEIARDHVPTGELETMIERISASDFSGEGFMFTNGWLAGWAKYTADRLSSPTNRQVGTPSV